jgi:uncharacterized protein YbjT (DUF2867 family)
MQIAILGATGGIGGHVLDWALQAGHPVHALARDPQALSPAAGLTVTRGDALDETAVAEVIDGADAVVSALGPRGTKAPGLLAGAAGHAVAAMQKTGARRLVCVSAAGAYVTGDPNMNWLIKTILPRVLARQFADVRAMEDVIRASDLDWTLIRATRLINRPGTGRYRVSPDYSPAGGGKIARADVAHFIAAVLTEDGWPRAAPALAY